MLYTSRDNGVCVRGVDGSNEHCFDRQSGEFDGDSAVWSPDAITETHSLGLEPDIWVLDLASGELINLTDDGVEAELDLTGGGGLPNGADVDVFPSWNPDGNGIRFLRKKSDTPMAMMGVPAGGGEVTELGVVGAARGRVGRRQDRRGVRGGRCVDRGPARQ